jgi:septal ring factor EnvC (AmiA/AmiB activator)
LRDDEKRLRRQIDTTRATIDELRNQVSFLKNHYAQYVRSAYKYGRTYDLELLLSSRSVNQALIRARYLQRFSQQRRNDLARLTTKQEEIERQNLILQSQLTKQREIIVEKSREEARLQRSMKQRKQVLADIRKNKKNFQREMERKRIAARDIEQLIEKLIEEERIRREREEARARERKEPVPAPATGAFDAMRGKLRWPVDKGKLVARFGMQQHPILKTVTQNTGIDISVPPGTDVHAVAPGEVSTIWWLPSFGNLVIINHYNGYRTVYAHLSEIEVREGEKVHEGMRIGKSGESLAGPLVHFEVWKFKEKQDPELWLRAR